MGAARGLTVAGAALDLGACPWLLRAVRRLTRPLLAASLVLTTAFGAASGRATPSQADLAAQVDRLERDAATRALVKDPVARAHRALDRAHAMEQTGDSSHATLLRDTAAEWLGMAADLIRAAAAEARARSAEKDLVDTETKLVRGRALLEETIARKSRAEAQLEELSGSARSKDTSSKPPAAKTSASPKKEPAR